MKKILLLLLLCISQSVYSKTFESGDLKLDVNGYVGYKYIASTAENNAIQSAPELGLALSLQAGNHVTLYTQFAYDEVQLSDALIYSFASFDWQFENELKVSLKGGKLRHNLGMYNATRVNPRTRQGVIMPQAIYWDSLSHLLTSGVGVGIDLTWHGLEAGYIIDEPVSSHPVQEARSWTRDLLDYADVSFGSYQSAYLKYSFDDVPLRVKSSWMHINLGSATSKVANFLFPDKKNTDEYFDIFLNSVEYDITDKLTVSGESIFVKSYFNSYDDIKQWSNGYSFSANYEITENLSTRVNYNYYNSQQLQNTPTIPWYLKHTTDVNVGLNYHRDNWMIGVEGHMIQGGRWAMPDDFRADPTSYKEWYMVGVNAVYFF
jgi:hypothetical protein